MQDFVHQQYHGRSRDFRVLLIFFELRNKSPGFFDTAHDLVQTFEGADDIQMPWLGRVSISEKEPSG